MGLAGMDTLFNNNENLLIVWGENTYGFLEMDVHWVFVRGIMMRE